MLMKMIMMLSLLLLLLSLFQLEVNQSQVVTMVKKLRARLEVLISLLTVQMSLPAG